jgi:hypothetical protein
VFLDLFVGAALASFCSAAVADERRAVPAYTNADLDRIAPRRGETGVTSTPAVDSVAAGRAPTRADQPFTESYWRNEADRVRQRVRELRDRAQALRERAEDRRAQGESSRRGSTRRREQSTLDPGNSFERDAARLEALARDEDDRLAERARRARALPGWIR